MTIFPNSVKAVLVVTTARPVTQVAEVAVKSASMMPRPRPSWVAKGKESKDAPMRMIDKYPKDRICADVRLLNRNVGIGTCGLLIIIPPKNGKEKRTREVLHSSQK